MDSYTDLFNGRDYRFGRDEEYRVVKCNNCGLIYLNPRPATESISKLYEKEYTPDNEFKIRPELETKKWRIILKKFWHKINGQYIDEIISKAQGRILDVGCGNGHFLLPLKDKGFEVYGIEINPESVEICKELGLKAICGTLEEAKFPNEFFETIIMSQVLEHLPSPKASLKEIFRILKPGGKVFIYCPNAQSYLARLFSKYWHGWHLPFHFFAFTPETIKKLVIETGFKLSKIETATPDNFFIVSLKGFLFGEKKNITKPVEQGKFFDSLFFRLVIAPFFRLLDFLTQNGDCLKAQLEK